MKSVEYPKYGFVISLRARDHPGFHVSRQRIPGAGWFPDTISSITKKDPAAQFLVSFRSKWETIFQSLKSGIYSLNIQEESRVASKFHASHLQAFVFR
ncbi:C-terminal binding protein AN [Dendrobium catenatum]|uniref:C-terminal binding protein AN n=1 Tax=Dendrobium catenatum TaxID=906689 RepID=A0A2I0VWN1_9ASPA|nr:C-terminal binding protein AN [Dendrobium catenatum]